jgi:hypothetical protein
MLDMNFLGLVAYEWSCDVHIHNVCKKTYIRASTYEGAYARGQSVRHADMLGLHKIKKLQQLEKDAEEYAKTEAAIKARAQEDRLVCMWHVSVHVCVCVCAHALTSISLSLALSINLYAYIHAREYTHACIDI